MKHWIALSLLVAAFHAGAAQAQKLSERSECEAINGTWTLQTGQPARVATCILTRSYTLPSGTRLTVNPGIDISVRQGGQLTIDGELDLLDTTTLELRGGNVFNNGRIITDGRASVIHNSGWLYNYSELAMDGDLIVNYSRIDPNSGARYCLMNFGVISAFSGSNIHSRGCIDGQTTGRLHLHRGAKMYNKADAIYRGMRDRIDGEFENWILGYAEFGNTTIGTLGAISNRGRIRATRDFFNINEDADLTVHYGGEFLVQASTFRVDGIASFAGGDLDTTQRTVAIQVGTHGAIRMTGESVARHSSLTTTVANDGGIGVECKATWQQTASH
ncbi:MAG: hypothetical protein AAAFM81_11470, partial [Pseudomonadota bacterium]